MDFNTFVIAGPSTSTFTVGFETGGSATTAAGVPYTSQTQCLTDTFTITGVPGGTPPVICGTNSGYHGKIFFIGVRAFFMKRHIKNDNIKLETVIPKYGM